MANELHGKSGNIALSGTGATFNFTSTAGGALGAVTVNAPGAGYNVGDVLTVGGGSGTITVSTVNASGGITAIASPNPTSAGAGYGVSIAFTAATSTVSSTASVVSGIKSWTIKFAQGATEVTNFSDLGAKRYILGETGWSGSFAGAKTGTPINPTLGLYTGIFQESASSTQKWVGSIIITDVSPKVDVKGVVEYSYSFQGSGPLAWPTA
jgi:hypothetical protein